MDSALMRKLGMHPELKTKEDDVPSGEAMEDFMAARMAATLLQDDEPIDVKAEMGIGLLDEPQTSAASAATPPADESNPLAMFLQAGETDDEAEAEESEEMEALLARMGRKPTEKKPEPAEEPADDDADADADASTPITGVEIRVGFVNELKAREEAIAGVRKLIAPAGKKRSRASAGRPGNAAALPVSEVLSDLAKVLRAAAVRGRAGFSAAAAAAAGLDSLASAVAQL